VTALLYFIVAVLAVGLSVGAFVEDRLDPARQAFLAFAVALALAYVGFSLSLLPNLGWFRALYLFAGTCVPAAAWWTFDRTFRLEGASGPRWLWLGTAVVAPVGTLLHLWFSRGPAPSAGSALGGLFSMVALATALQRLWRIQAITPLRIDRVRMTWMFGVISAAVVMTFAEQLGRLLFPVVPTDLSVSSRAVALQGPIPPVSAVFAGLGTYFLYHSVVMSRLLDVTELLARITTVLLSAAVLLVIDGLTFLWVDTFTVFPFHSTFQILLASILFLAAYDPLRSWITWGANRLFDRRSHQLRDALEQLERLIPTLIDPDTLGRELLDTVHRSGRVPATSLYVWDPRHDAFTCVGWRGAADRAPLHVVSAHPFADRFGRGAPWYLASTVRRRALHDPQQAEVLALMDAMHADLTLPMVSGHTVLGWLHVADEQWSDGFSAEEILAFQRVADRAATALANLRSFAALEEQKRMAALGAMSAGLAHEIRNPLAGVKGAAQFLRADPAIGDESKEMLDIIVGETDRLNTVVSEFLDYARPFELMLGGEPVQDVLRRTLALVRAQGLPPGVVVTEEYDPATPQVPLDPVRAGQVFLNLAQNALQAMPAGGALTVRSRPGRDRRGRAGAEIQVSDTGVGIAPDALAQVFVPFFTTKPKGTGLGLAISQRIVRAHGGELEVASVPGEGTTFVVFLPAADPASDR
jgi:two-component system sensor histidine kinase HydH